MSARDELKQFLTDEGRRKVERLMAEAAAESDDFDIDEAIARNHADAARDLGIDPQPIADPKAADWSGAVFCMTRCYACMYGECPGVPHTWGAPDDFAHAWATFQDAPGFCGCSCGRPARTPPKVRVRHLPGFSDVLRSVPGFETARNAWGWNCPNCAGGGASAHPDALADAVKHRWSEKCKHRRSTT